MLPLHQGYIILYTSLSLYFSRLFMYKTPLPSVEIQAVEFESTHERGLSSLPLPIGIHLCSAGYQIRTDTG